MDPRSSNPCCSRDNRRSFTRLLNTALHVTTEWQTWMGSFILSLSSIICGISYSSLIDFCFRLVFSVSHILWGTFLNYSISSLFFSLFTLWSVYFLDIETSRLIICFFCYAFLPIFHLFVFFLNAMDWMFVSPQIIYWNLMPNVMVLRGGAFGRCLGHHSGAHMIGIDVPMKETPQSLPSPFCHVRL